MGSRSSADSSSTARFQGRPGLGLGEEGEAPRISINGPTSPSTL